MTVRFTTYNMLDLFAAETAEPGSTTRRSPG
jgi:hypothetical protein